MLTSELLIFIQELYYYHYVSSFASAEQMEVDSTEHSNASFPIGLDSQIFLSSNPIQNEQISKCSKLYLRQDYYSNLKMLGFTYKQDPSVTIDKHFYGYNASFSTDYCTVTRHNSYSNCVVFMSQPIEVNDIIQLEFLSEAQGWAGHMRFGITTQAPRTLKTIPPNGMTFYARNDYWILSSGKLHNHNREDDYQLNFENLKVGDIVALSIDSKNQMSFYKNGIFQGIAVSNLPKGNKYQAVIDVYGSAKSIKLTYLRHQSSLKEQCLMIVYKKLSRPEAINELPLPYLLKESLREMF